MSETTEPRDWRGTPIRVGDTVIYGAGVGRSIALVEAEVTGFTDSGRVWLSVTHRAYGGGWGGSNNRVHVGADRLTIVRELPPTDLPTETEKSAESRARVRASYEARLADLRAGAREPHGPWETEEYLLAQIKRNA